MFDFTTIPTDVLLARGQYATVRAEHEDAKKELQMLTGQLGATAAQILRAMQPNNGIPAMPDAQLFAGRSTLDSIEMCSARIADLAQQRADLRDKAWGRT